MPQVTLKTIEQKHYDTEQIEQKHYDTEQIIP